MRSLLAILAVFGIGCASTPIVTTPVFPFGPDAFTTSASTAFESPNSVREEVITLASTFCEMQGARSLPTEINLITSPPRSPSNSPVHSATVVFHCFDPKGANEPEERI